MSMKINPTTGKLDLVNKDEIIKLTLGEDLAEGVPVYVYDDVGVAKIKKVFTSVEDGIQIADAYYVAICKVDTDKVVVAYRDRTTSYGMVVAVDLSTGEAGTPVAAYAGVAYYLDICEIDTNKFAFTFYGGSLGRVVIGTVSGTSITVGSNYAYSTSYAYYIRCCKMGTNRFASVWRDGSTGYYGKAIIGQVSGLVPTFGSSVDFYAGSTYYPVCNRKDDQLIVVYGGLNLDLYAKVATVTGTLIGAFTPSGDGELLHAGTCYPEDLIQSDGKSIVLFRDVSYMKSHAFIVTGSNISPGTTSQLSESYSYSAAGAPAKENYILGVYSHNIVPYQSRFKMGYTPLTETDWGDYAKFLDTNSYDLDVCALIEGDNHEHAVVYATYTTFDTYVFKLGSGSNKLGECIGILEKAGIQGDVREVKLLGQITRHLTGTPGDVLYIQSDASISNVKSEYPIGLVLDDNKVLLGKDIIRD